MPYILDLLIVLNVFDTAYTVETFILTVSGATGRKVGLILLGIV